MRKLIHSKFELDLSNFRISDTEENNWFSDVFFTKYSFPFEIDLTDDLDVAFGFISLYNSSSRETYYELKYVHGDKIEDAVFEIEQHQTKLSCTLRFGFEQLPSFDKKLSELSLQKLALPSGTDIYEHAETIIPQTWPAVNYNFPQVHIDKIDSSEELWAFFDGKINSRKDGAFLINDMDVPNSIFRNRNIMQPLPYLFHVLERGMADANLVLAGEILDDEDLKKVTLYADVEYYKKYLDESLIIYKESFENIPPVIDYYNGIPMEVRYYKASATIINAGVYKLTGKIALHRFTNSDRKSRITIKYRDTVLKHIVRDAYRELQYQSFNFNFQTINDLNPHEITVEVFTGPYRLGLDAPIIDLEINPVTLFDANVTVISTIININKIDLTKTVADITFGDIIRNIKNWYNYDLTVEGNLAIMNKVESQINYEDAISFQRFEVKNPIRKLKQGNSYLLKFQDVESNIHTFSPVFQDRNSIVNSGYKVTEKTNTIEINALPLPLLTRNGSQTAHAFESGAEKLYFVIYDGLVNGNNVSKINTNYLLPIVHENNWRKWMNLRINSQAFSWSFKSFNEDIFLLKTKVKLFCYDNYHVVKTINKTEIKPDLFEITIETETLD
ncbi:hypothetical protein [Flavobacterium sp.]|uniref:hypothetical protein n=1 Tax=Flavobacterium sp. TaxID=239 RepID=UPI003753AC38